MRGIDKHVNALSLEIGCKPRGAAKAAAAIGNLRHTRRFGAAGERQHAGDAALPSKQTCELTRFRCPAKHEYPHRLFPKLLLSPP